MHMDRLTDMIRQARACGSPPVPPGAAPFDRRAPLTAPIVRARPLLTQQGVRLHQWLLDRIEAEAPTCTLHAGVALHGFLNVEPPDGGDALCGLAADFLVLDEAGQAVAVLMREDGQDAETRLRTRALLAAAEVPVVDIPAHPRFAPLWSRIAELLPGG